MHPANRNQLPPYPGICEGTGETSVGKGVNVGGTAVAEGDRVAVGGTSVGGIGVGGTVVGIKVALGGTRVGLGLAVG